MSPPPPWTVHVLLLSVSLPAGVGKPTSSHVHPEGQRLGGVGALLVIVTLLNVALPTAPVLCAVTARPARIAPDRLGSETVELAIGVQVLPSADV